MEDGSRSRLLIRLVHLTLALLLTPALAVVLAVGGLGWLIEMVVREARRDQFPCRNARRIFD
jgi:hypothetical protein